MGYIMFSTVNPGNPAVFGNNAYWVTPRCYSFTRAMRCVINACKLAGAGQALIRCVMSAVSVSRLCVASVHNFDPSFTERRS